MHQDWQLFSVFCLFVLFCFCFCFSEVFALIFRVLDEAKRQKPALPTAEDPNRPYDGSSLFDKLASLIDKPQSQLFDTDAYSVSI